MTQIFLRSKAASGWNHEAFFFSANIQDYKAQFAPAQPSQHNCVLHTVNLTGSDLRCAAATLQQQRKLNILSRYTLAVRWKAVDGVARVSLLMFRFLRLESEQSLGYSVYIEIKSWEQMKFAGRFPRFPRMFHQVI